MGEVPAVPGPDLDHLPREPGQQATAVFVRAALVGQLGRPFVGRREPGMLEV
ncbi:hypothetical protein ACFQYP_05605 [Nonomuraea antimicrobica]